MLLEVSTTYGGVLVVNVPTSGTETWNSASVSSSTASSASSARSTSSISSTTGSGDADGLQQRARGQEALGEEHALLRADPLDRGRPGRGRRRRPGRSSRAGSGCRAAACRSPTRRGPWSRPGPRSTAAAAAGARWPRPAPWPARSCRPRPAPRSAAACAAGWSGRRWWRAGCRRCSRARPSSVDDVVDGREAVGGAGVGLGHAAPFLESPARRRAGADGPRGRRPIGRRPLRLGARCVRSAGRRGRRSCSGRPPGAPSRRCTPWRCPGCRRRRARGW